jgi:hypothetical protein
MKKVVEFWKVNEQSLTFILIVLYLNCFWIYFYEEMAKNDWLTGFFTVQFFGLCTFLGLRSRKKGWKLPKNVKETH